MQFNVSAVVLLYIVIFGHLSCFCWIIQLNFIGKYSKCVIAQKHENLAIVMEIIQCFRIGYNILLHT